MLSLRVSMNSGSIGTFWVGISWIRPLNRGHPHTNLLLWYLLLPERGNHPLGAIWDVNHHRQSFSVYTVATGSSAERPPSSHLLLPRPPTLSSLPGYCTQPHSSTQQPDLLLQHLFGCVGWGGVGEWAQPTVGGGCDGEREAGDRGRQIK